MQQRRLRRVVRVSFLAGFLDSSDFGRLLLSLAFSFSSRWIALLLQTPIQQTSRTSFYFFYFFYFFFSHANFQRFGNHPREELDELLPLDVSEDDHHVNTTDHETDLHDVAYPSGFASFLAVSAYNAFKCFVFGLKSESLLFNRNDPSHATHVEGSHTKYTLKMKPPALLFGHGGGWVCQGTDVQLGQLPPIARAGFAIYTFNYPLAPEDRFPTALLTTLRAMSWLKRVRDYDEISLLGESAGGNLVTLAALFVNNPKLLVELQAALPENHPDKNSLLEWKFPRVKCVVSWYSILDSSSWRFADNENKSDDDKWLHVGLEKVWDLYLSEENVLKNRITLCDYGDDELRNYPPCLIVAGKTDPLGLGYSAKEAHKRLTTSENGAELKLYDATHGFIGYPIQMQALFARSGADHWRDNCWEATKETIAFLRRHAAE